MGALEADEEYRIIETALLDTPRGRWFLTEHGRRSRRVDASALDDAIHQLQSSLRNPPAVLSVIRSDVERLCTYISQERQALQLSGPTTPASMSPRSDTLQHQTANMLTAAEDLHALVWSIRDQLPTPDLCEAIARQSSRIYAMSHATAAESAHAAKFSVAMEETYTRLSALLETILAEMQPSDPQRRTAYLPPSR